MSVSLLVRPSVCPSLFACPSVRLSACPSLRLCVLSLFRISCKQQTILVACNFRPIIIMIIWDPNWLKEVSVCGWNAVINSAAIIKTNEPLGTESLHERTLHCNSPNRNCFVQLQRWIKRFLIFSVTSAAVGESFSKCYYACPKLTTSNECICYARSRTLVFI